MISGSASLLSWGLPDFGLELEGEHLYLVRPVGVNFGYHDLVQPIPPFLYTIISISKCTKAMVKLLMAF